MRLPILPPPPNSEGKARNGRGGIDLDGWEWDGDLVDPAQVSASTKRSHPFTSPFPLPDARRPPPPVNVSTSTLVVAEVERQGKQRSKSLCPIRSWREKRKMSRGPTTSSVSLQQPQIPPHDHHSAHPPARNLKSMPSITETPVPPVPAKQLPQVYQTLDTWVRRDAPPQVPPRSIDRVWAPTRPQARDPQSRPEAWRELSDMSGMNHPGGVRVPLVLVSESLQQSPSTTARSIEVMATEQDKRTRANRHRHLPGVPADIQASPASTASPALPVAASSKFTIIPANRLPTRFRRAMRPSTAPSTLPSGHTETTIPLTQLAPRDASIGTGHLNEESRKEGMSVLSFLALKDDQLHLPGIGGDPQDQARSRVSIDLLGQGKIRLERQQSDGKAVKHIMPLEELAKFALNRSSSTSSDGRLDQFSPRSPVPLVQEHKVELAAFMRSSPLLSPPSSPVSPKKLASPSIPTSLVPPPRRRGSSTAPSSDARFTPHPFGTGGPTHPRRTPTHRELPDTPTSPSRSEPKDRSSTLQSGSSPDLSFRSAWSGEREIERKRLEEWLASKPRRAGRGGMEKLSRTDVRGAQGI